MIPEILQVRFIINMHSNKIIFNEYPYYLADPFVKIALVHNGKRLKKRKTTVLRNTVAPVFNEQLTFDIAKDTLKTCLIEFLVLHDSLLGTNELLGRSIVGNSADVRIEEKNFFDEMFRTKSATAQWLPLSDPRTTNSR